MDERYFNREIQNPQSAIRNPQSAIEKGVIPAAGLGTRMFPLARTVPKELFPVDGRPVIHHVVEEAATAGLSEVAIVIRPGKEIIREYFDRLPEGERPGGVRIHYVYQDEPRGLGDALLCARDFVGTSPFAVLLPDDLYLDANPTRDLVMAFQEFPHPILAVGAVPAGTAGGYGKVALEARRVGERLRRVHYMFPKGEGPRTTNPAAGHLNSFGRYLLTPEVFEPTYDRHPGVELDDGDLIRGLIRRGPVYGFLVSYTRFDTGRISTYADAVAAFNPLSFSSEFGVRSSEFRVKINQPRTPGSGLRAPNSELRTPNSELRYEVNDADTDHQAVLQRR